MLSVIFNLRKASSGGSGRQPSSEGCQIEGMRIMTFFFFFPTLSLGIRNMCLCMYWLAELPFSCMSGLD